MWYVCCVFVFCISLILVVVWVGCGLTFPVGLLWHSFLVVGVVVFWVWWVCDEFVGGWAIGFGFGRLIVGLVA